MENSDLERKRAKAAKYTTEPERFTFLSLEVNMSSIHGNRSVSYSDGTWQCSCDFYSQNRTCSHIMAMQSLLSKFDFERDS